MSPWKQLGLWFWLVVSGFCSCVYGAEVPVANTDRYELRFYWGGMFTMPQEPQLTVPVQVEFPFSAKSSEIFQNNPITRVMRIEDPVYATVYYHGSGVLHAPQNGKFKLEYASSKDNSPQFAPNWLNTLELELDKPQSHFLSGGLVQGYKVVLSKNSRPILFAAELPPGAQVKREIPSWGKEVDGLQLGIDLDFLNRPYSIGEVASFTFTVRNNTKKSIRLRHYKPDLAILPFVVNENDKPLTLQQEAGLAMVYAIPVFPVTTVVEPNGTAEVATAQLTIGPARKDESNPNLDVPPGKYKVSYSYSFANDGVGETKKVDWSGTLKSGQVLLEVVRNPATSY